MQSIFQVHHRDGAKKEKNLWSEQTIPRINLVWVQNTQPSDPGTDIWGPNLRAELLYPGWATFVSFESPSNMPNMQQTWSGWCSFTPSSPVIVLVLIRRNSQHLALAISEKGGTSSIWSAHHSCFIFLWTDLHNRENKQDINKNNSLSTEALQSHFSLNINAHNSVILFFLLKYTEEELNL